MGDVKLPLLRTDALEFAPGTMDAIEYVAANLRDSDADEIHATCGHRDYLVALRYSAVGSDDYVVAVSAVGEPVAVLGVSTLSVLYSTGCPWLLATPRLMLHRRAFITLGKAYTAAMLRKYNVLTNHVDARNKASVAWLQRLGYTLEPAKPYGAFGLPFHTFSKGV